MATYKQPCLHCVEYIERVRDTTIYIPVPVEVKEIVVRRDSSYLSTSLAESQAIIMPDGALFHSLQNRPLSVPVVVPVWPATPLHAIFIKRPISIIVGNRQP